MRILDANTLTPDVKELLLELIGSAEQSPEEIKVWLTLNLGTDVFGAWIAIDDDEEPAGVLTCEVVEQATEPKVFISFWEPRLKELLEKCEQWSKEKNISKLIYHTKSAKRINGFKLERAVMIKEIE